MLLAQNWTWVLKWQSNCAGQDLWAQKGCSDTHAAFHIRQPWPGPPFHLLSPWGCWRHSHLQPTSDVTSSLKPFYNPPTQYFAPSGHLAGSWPLIHSLPSIPSPLPITYLRIEASSLEPQTCPWAPSSPPTSSSLTSQQPAVKRAMPAALLCEKRAPPLPSRSG